MNGFNLETIGILRSNWYQNNEVYIINYGTAIAISDRILLTCTHNIFLDRRGYAGQIIFLPGVDQGKIGKNRKQYKSARHQYIRSDKLSIFQNRVPIKEQLALIYFEQSFDFQEYHKVGQLDQSENQQIDLTVVGYPSQKFNSQVVLENCRVDRKIHHGTLYQERCTGVIMSYTMETGMGFSGGPVFARDQETGKMKIVGVHTHRGRQQGYNSGLRFTQDIVERLNKWKNELQRRFKPNDEDSLMEDMFSTSFDCDKMQDSVQTGGSSTIDSQKEDGTTLNLLIKLSQKEKAQKDAQIDAMQTCWDEEQSIIQSGVIDEDDAYLSMYKELQGNLNQDNVVNQLPIFTQIAV